MSSLVGAPPPDGLQIVADIEGCASNADRPLHGDIERVAKRFGVEEPRLGNAELDCVGMHLVDVARVGTAAELVLGVG